MQITLLKPEDNNTIKTPEALAEYARRMVKEASEPDEREKARDEQMEAKIMAKLKAGKKLTQEELEYLQRTNPALYAHAMKVQLMANAIEERLKHVRSKEEANDIITDAIGGISKNDPDKEYLLAAINRISTEMHRSAQYSRLPDAIEDAKKNKHPKQNIKFKDAKEEEKEDSKNQIDLMNWTPLQEVIDELPKFIAGA